jgi:hypothetical protein
MVKRAEVARLFFALLAGALVLALPLVASACPICAGRSAANPYAQAALIGAFVFFPFSVAYTVVRYIRAGMRRLDAASLHSIDDGDP